MRLLAIGLLSIGLLALALLAPAPARAEAVDLELVFAADGSGSIDDDELRLQRQGWAEALTSPDIQAAIRDGAIGAIAVAYMEWGGPQSQVLIVDWHVVRDQASAQAFADRLLAAPRGATGWNSISNAIDFSVRLVEGNAIEGTRRVIDVSGDGPNNQGRIVTQARSDAVAKGITVNGLPLMLRRPGYLDIAELDTYYRDCVIGGQGAFLVPVRGRDQFAQAIKTKILLEIAGLTPPEPLMRRVQAPARTDCLVGETQWRDRMGN